MYAVYDITTCVTHFEGSEQQCRDYRTSFALEDSTFIVPVL